MEIKDAVQQAMTFAKDSLGPKGTVSLRLEEIESSSVKDRQVWLVTLSSYAPSTRRNAGAIGADLDREYKVFTVAKDTGEVLSMKIRLFAVPAA